MEEQRKKEIDNENRIMLQKMSAIMASKNEEFHTADSKDKKRSKSLNVEQRQRQQDRLDEENVKAAKRLENTKPIYSTKKWEDDYEQKQKLMESWQRTKSQNKNNNKGNDDKLPPINSAESKENKSQSNHNSPHSARSSHSNCPPNTSRSDRSHSPKSSKAQRKKNQKSPDRELWMYYGIRPGDSDDEDDFYNQSPYLDPAKEKERRRKHREGRKTTDIDVKELRKVAKRMAPPHDIITRTLAKKTLKYRINVKEKYKDTYETKKKNLTNCKIKQIIFNKLLNIQYLSYRKIIQ
ncbi:hypothetical protein Btru_052033 [Bulinus truncatus]|nr:hypothetical protein Btru_052033 [Bulinus truncatus]